MRLGHHHHSSCALCISSLPFPLIWLANCSIKRIKSVLYLQFRTSPHDGEYPSAPIFDAKLDNVRLGMAPRPSRRCLRSPTVPLCACHYLYSGSDLAVRKFRAYRLHAMSLVCPQPACG
eukprot:scaffold789_cov26-Tisochrysis_lutea.AAC.4